MSAFRSAVISLDDHQLIEAIRAATRRLLVVAPGLSLPVAQAVRERWLGMDAGSVQVLLDADPEVCRMGYGTIDALDLLEKTAAQLNCAVHHRPGVRIGVVICEHTALVFSPTPLLVEKLPSEIPHPNAIRFDQAPSPSLEAGSLDAEARDLIEGGEPVDASLVQSAAHDLSVNPPFAELEAMVEGRKPAALTFKAGEKGGVSVYGLGRFPLTLYYEPWIRLLERGDDLKPFLEENKGRLKLRAKE